MLECEFLRLVEQLESALDFDIPRHRLPKPTRRVGAIDDYDRKAAIDWLRAVAARHGKQYGITLDRQHRELCKLK